MTIGRVGDIRLTGHGAEAQVIVNDEAPKIPADTDAVVANRSAVGEQYLDFRPRRAGGPVLAEGAVIPKERTKLPLPVESVLASVDDLVASVPLDALRTVTPPLAREISILLRESGPDLGLLLANLLTTAEVMAPRLGGLEHSLVVYPMAIQAGRTVVTPEGKARVGHVVTYFDPLPCAAGYQGTVYREGRDVAPALLNTGARCALPDGHPGSVRGSQNAPAGSRSGRELRVVGPASMEHLLGLPGSGG